jgi:hypothetical protein
LNIVELPVVFVAILLTAIAVAVSAAICILLLSLVHRFVRVKRICTHNVILKNQGNVRSVYQLLAESPEPKLRFRFFSQKIPLAEIAVEAPVIQQPEAASNHKTVTARQASSAAGKVEKTSRAAAQKTGVAASFLSALGNLLPGSVGKSLKQQGAAARNIQTKTTQTMGAKDQAERQVNALQRGASKLGVKSQAPSTSGTGRKQSAGSSFSSTPSSFQVAQTNPIGPGETIALTLQISSQRKRIPEGSYLYTITSQQVPLEKVDRETHPVNQPGMVYFAAVSAWRYALPIFLNILITVVVLSAFVYTLSLIWA